MQTQSCPSHYLYNFAGTTLSVLSKDHSSPNSTHTDNTPPHTQCTSVTLTCMCTDWAHNTLHKHHTCFPSHLAHKQLYGHHHTPCPKPPVCVQTGMCTSCSSPHTNRYLWYAHLYANYCTNSYMDIVYKQLHEHNTHN